MVIFQFSSNSCNVLLKRSFWIHFYVLESSDTIFLTLCTFVLCWRGSFSLQLQPGFQHQIQMRWLCVIDLDLLQMLDHNQDLQKNTHRVTIVFMNNISTNLAVSFVVTVLYSKTAISVRLALDLLMHRSTNVWYQDLGTPTVGGSPSHTKKHFYR